MSSPRFEAFLARLYGDRQFAEQFIAEPEPLLRAALLDAHERRAALAIDPLELRLASTSYAAKRLGRRRNFGRRLLDLLKRIGR